MFSVRNLLVLIPIYLAFRVGLDAVFDSALLDTHGPIPLWLGIAFACTAVVVALIVVWLVGNKVVGRVSPNRERALWGIVVAVVLAEMVEGGLNALASHAFHIHSIWLAIPIYLISLFTALWVYGAILGSRTSSGLQRRD